MALNGEEGVPLRRLTLGGICGKADIERVRAFPLGLLRQLSSELVRGVLVVRPAPGPWSSFRPPTGPKDDRPGSGGRKDDHGPASSSRGHGSVAGPSVCREAPVTLPARSLHLSPRERPGRDGGGDPGRTSPQFVREGSPPPSRPRLPGPRLPGHACPGRGREGPSLGRPSNGQPGPSRPSPLRSIPANLPRGRPGRRSGSPGPCRRRRRGASLPSPRPRRTRRSSSCRGPGRCRRSPSR